MVDAIVTSRERNKQSFKSIKNVPARDFFPSRVEYLERILLHKNIKTGMLKRESSIIQWEFQEIIERRFHKKSYCQ